MQNDFKSSKLTIGFMLIITLFLFLELITLKGLFNLGNLTRTIYEHPLVVSNAALNAALNIRKIQQNMIDALFATSYDEFETVISSLSLNEKEVNRQLDIIRDNILGEDGQHLERDSRNMFINWEPIKDEFIRLSRSGDNQYAIFFLKSKGTAHVDSLELKMLEISSYARRKADDFLLMTESQQRNLKKHTIYLVIVGIFISLFIAFISINSTLKSRKLLLDKNSQLQKALSEIKVLRGIIPICSHCKQIRDDEGIWKQIEDYFNEHSQASFSHSICPGCIQKLYPEIAASCKIQLVEK